jgi:integrase
MTTRKSTKRRRRGSVREKSPGRWHYAVSVPDATRPSGRRQIAKGPFASRRAAEEALTRALAALDERTLSTDVAATMTVSAYADVWLEQIAGLRRPTTIAFYRDQVRTRIASTALGRMALRDVNTSRLGKWLSEVRRQTTRSGAPLSDSTVHAGWRTLRALLAHAVDAGVIAVAPKPPKSMAASPGDGRAHIAPWTDEEIRRWLAAVDDHELGSAFRLMYAAGLRRGEVCGLIWRHIDVERGVLEIVATRVMAGGRPVTSLPKTDRGRRSVALDADHRDRLRRHQLAQREHALAAGLTWTDDWPFVADAIGRPVSPDYITRLMAELCDAAGVPRRHVHDIRHLHVTLMIEAGVPLHIASRRVGHSSIAITSDLYGHVRDRTAADAADTFGDHMARRLGS